METLHFYKGDPLVIYLSTDGNNYSSMQIGEKNKFNVTISRVY